MGLYVMLVCIVYKSSQKTNHNTEGSRLGHIKLTSYFLDKWKAEIGSVGRQKLHTK